MEQSWKLMWTVDVERLLLALLAMLPRFPPPLMVLIELKLLIWLEFEQTDFPQSLSQSPSL
jgi:hypothetical protein